MSFAWKNSNTLLMVGLSVVLIVLCCAVAKTWYETNDFQRGNAPAWVSPNEKWENNVAHHERVHMQFVPSFVRENDSASCQLSTPPRAPQDCRGVANGNIGLLKETGSSHGGRVMPLFATEHPTRRGRFWYHTLTDGNIPLKVGVTSGSRSCVEEIGCDELYDGDVVTVPMLGGGEYTVSLYPRRGYLV